MSDGNCVQLKTNDERGAADWCSHWEPRLTCDKKKNKFENFIDLNLKYKKYSNGLSK